MRDRERGSASRRQQTQMHEAVNTVTVYRLSCEHRNLLLHYLSQMSIYVCVYVCLYMCVCALLRSKTHVFGMCCPSMNYSTETLMRSLHVDRVVSQNFLYLAKAAPRLPC